jgi:hypothetical protein
MFSLSDMVRMAAIPPSMPEHSMSAAGVGLDWELVLPAFLWRIGRGGFAGLQAASSAMSTLLRRIEKSGIDETEIEAFRPGELRLTPCENRIG